MTSLYLRSVDCDGARLDASIRTLLDGWPLGTAVWAIVEQMHTAVFAGNDSDAVIGALSEAWTTYALRGRVFWRGGQLLWRRLSHDRFRAVLATDDPIPSTWLAPATEHNDRESRPDAEWPVDVRDNRVILWGRSEDGNGFKEARVDARGLRYPLALEEAAVGTRGMTYPVLRVRRYVDADGEDVFWRFVDARIEPEQELTYAR